MLPDGHDPAISTHSLFRVLERPLQAVLSGRCFSAVLAKPTEHTRQHRDFHKTDYCGHYRNRHVATNFKVLGDSSLNVLSFLTKYLSTNKPVVGHRLWFDSGKEGHERGMAAVGERYCSSGSSNFSSSTVLSLVSSTDTQQTRNVLLESYNSELQSFTFGSMSLTSKENTPHNCSTSVSKLTSCGLSHPTIHSIASSPLISSASINACSNASGNVEGEGLEEDSFLFDSEHQATSSFCEQWSQSLDDLPFSDDLPDSESFLEELQCDFELLSVPASNTPSSSIPKSRETPHQSVQRLEREESSKSKKERVRRSFHLLQSHYGKMCLKKGPPLSLTPSACASHFTPELFTDSATIFPLSGSQGDKLSPELFGSPSITANSLVQLPSTIARDEDTPSIGEQVRALPKRCLVRYLPRSDSPWNRACTPVGHIRKSSDGHCFTPELFP